MNILLVIRHFDFGGAENHVCDLANGLAKKGHRVFLLARSGRQVARLHHDVEFLRADFWDYKMPFHLLWLVLFLKKQRIDAIHAHQHSSILISCIAGLLTGTRVVATVHGRNRYDLRSWVSKRLTNKIIYVSKAVQHYGEKRPFIKKKSVYIPNGIIMNGFAGKSIPGRVTYMSKVSHHHFSLLKMLIREVAPVVAKRHSHFQLHVTGDGYRLPKLEHEAVAVNKNAGKEIVVIDGYKPGLMSGVSKAALVMGVGRVALEACAGGIPVLSVNHKRLGGLLTAEKYGLVKYNNFIDTHSEPPTAREVISELSLFLENEQYWHGQARTISEWVCADFSMDRILDMVVQTYLS